MAEEYPIHWSTHFGTLEKLNKDLANYVSLYDNTNNPKPRARLLDDINDTLHAIEIPNPTICEGCGKPIGHADAMFVTEPRFGDGYPAVLHMTIINSEWEFRKPMATLYAAMPCLQAWARKHGFKPV